MTAAAPIRRGRGGRRGARAVTLIEVLVAASILAAILALAAPLALRSLDRRAFEAAQAELLAVIDAARAHAQREGAVVELSIDESGRRLHASAWPLDGGEPLAITSLRAAIPAPMRLVPDDGGDGEEAAGADVSGIGAAGGPTGAAGADLDATGGSLVLFLPDGSAPFSRHCILRGSEPGDDAVLTISATLGRARFERRRAGASIDEGAAVDRPASDFPAAPAFTSGATERAP